MLQDTRNVYKPSYLKTLCEKYHLSPSKKYGQNYLISERPIEEMLRAGELGAEDTVVEVGPGFGVLTFGILEKAKKLYAFEIEKKLEGYWEENIEKHKNLEIIWGNAVHHLEERTKDLGEYKFLANLPYQITSHILRTILELSNKPERIIVMVQKEVAERICAKKGDMSLLAVSVQYYGTASIVTKVKAGSFWPAPKVDSAVLMIVPSTPSTSSGASLQNNSSGASLQNNSSGASLQNSLGSSLQKVEDEKFFGIVKAAFAQKRKQIVKPLAKHLGVKEDLVRKMLNELFGNDKLRAEDLGVEDWKKIMDFDL